VFSTLIIFNDALLLIFNGSLWVPQIVRSYLRRSRFGPEPYFVYFLTLSHTFLPIYLRGCPSNVFERQPNYIFTLIFIAYLALQIFVVLQQRKRNPRFFVPLAWRKNPNAFNYFHKFSQKAAAVANQPDIERQEINDQEDCVICMNPLHLEVDANNGANISIGEGGQHKLAKYFMKTPCNHKYHVVCLKKWMEIRLECPSCRQVIPAIEEDD
jgi:hypothetical protein